MKKPAISIIMTVYNTEKYLNESIQSVVNQTFRDWELIIIDDGSTDLSPAIIDEWGRQDPRLRVVHKSQTGQADSRNTAIALAQGQYIGFVDSDDWIEPTMYEELYGLLQKEKADAALCAYTKEYKDCSVPVRLAPEIKPVMDKNEIVKAVFEAKVLSVLWSTLFSKSLISTPIPKIKFCEDYAVLLQWLKDAHCMVTLDKPSYHYRMRKSSIMHIKKNIEREITSLKLMKKHSQLVRQLNVMAKAKVDRCEACEYLRVAKLYARHSEHPIQRKAIVLTAQSMLKYMKDLDVSLIRDKDRKDIKLLKRSAYLFILKMRFSNVFVLRNYTKRKKSSHQLYE